MSALLGWLIYAAIAALVLFVPPLFGGKYGYWGHLRTYWGILGFSILGTGLIIGLIFLGMWAGDLVSGRA